MDKLRTAISYLKDAIKQYEGILQEIKLKPKYWELKQYTAVWHYLDGMKISLFTLENSHKWGL